ncbi:hypothetical protein JCM24511_09133 [Saitozyma sp. JCM 24511]|nr:hypothetical protein JCM24511_09133 [Saitozyma sp. JCM 24511]
MPEGNGTTPVAAFAATLESVCPVHVAYLEQRHKERIQSLHMMMDRLASRRVAMGSGGDQLSQPVNERLSLKESELRKHAVCHARFRHERRVSDARIAEALEKALRDHLDQVEGMITVNTYELRKGIDDYERELDDAKRNLDARLDREGVRDETRA